jgi:hypothetical protein
MVGTATSAMFQPLTRIMAAEFMEWVVRQNGSDFQTPKLRRVRSIVLQASQDGHWGVTHRRVVVEGAY